MSERTDHLSDEGITQFLRSRGADPDLALLADIVRTVGATPQDRPWLGLRPIRLRRRTLLVVALVLLLATMGALAVGSGLLVEPFPPEPSVDLGIFEPVAGRIVYDTNSGLWAVDPSASSPGSSLVRLAAEGSFTVPLGWSSDGTELLFLREDPTDQSFPYDRYLYILHADGTETQVTLEPVGAAAISPDGSRVVFAADRDDGLYVVDADGGEPVRIADGDEPTFSPDGTQIAYLSKPHRGCCVAAGREHVWLANADGTEAHEILVDEPALAEGVFGLTWSPAGDRIAMANSLEGHVAIYTFAPDGSDFTEVITGGFDPHWSPDGSQIAYGVPGRDGLWIADADGSDVRTLEFGASGPWHPGPLQADADPTPEPVLSGGLWPQASLEEVRQAQELADAGDPDFTWQLDPDIAEGDPANAEIVARFLREELGWEEFLFNGNVGWDQVDRNLFYVRCAPGGTNPLYPDDEYAGKCAPTIDELRYETVSIDLAQPVRSDPSGIWVVSGWAAAAPFAQTDPRVVEDRATAHLEEFLDARIAGEGAEGNVDVGGQRVFGTLDEVPLLYGTSTGAPYERYEIDIVGGPRWPYGDLIFDVRLFAASDETVVEQPFTWRDSRLSHDVTETKENGQPIGLAFAFLDGEVILTAAKPWEGGFERSSLDLGGPYYSGEDALQEAIVLVGDPLSAAAGCEIGPAPVDADALARSLQSDPDLQVTDPVAVTVGGVDGLQMDVVLAPGASDCGGGSVLRLADGSDRRGANIDRGSRVRLYLFDMPEGLATRILGIAIVAPEARFESVIEAAAPIIESMELDPR